MGLHFNSIIFLFSIYFKEYFDVGINLLSPLIVTRYMFNIFINSELLIVVDSLTMENK